MCFGNHGWSRHPPLPSASLFFSTIQLVAGSCAKHKALLRLKPCSGSFAVMDAALFRLKPCSGSFAVMDAALCRLKFDVPLRIKKGFLLSLLFILFFSLLLLSPF